MNESRTNLHSPDSAYKAVLPITPRPIARAVDCSFGILSYLYAQIQPCVNTHDQIWIRCQSSMRVFVAVEWAGTYCSTRSLNLRATTPALRASRGDDNTEVIDLVFQFLVLGPLAVPVRGPAFLEY